MDKDWVLYLWLLCPLVLCEVERSSLTFVIDDTMSMGDDIDQVEQGANMIFDTVMDSNSSPIENFILVTFNDPGKPKLLTKTTDRDEFKRTLANIRVYGGIDCPELAMGGIQLALEKSLPASYIYVFTDASAKDMNKLETVQNIAITKQSQIVFLLTGRCYDEDDEGDEDDEDDPNYQVFYKLAEATSGQVFHMQKHEIGTILSYISETIKSRKSVVTARKFPPGYDNKMTVPVDSAMKDVVLSVTGKDPKVDVTAPDGSKPDVKKVVNLPEVLAIKITNTIPGNYTSTLGSKSETSVVMTATTELQFKHGFSAIIPTKLKDTDTRPLPDEKSYLSIELKTTEEDKILDTVQILDIKENIVLELPLKLLDKKQKLYITEKLNPPNFLFKIAIKGHDTKHDSTFKRIGPTAIEPQKPTLVTTENRSPTITVDGGPIFEVDYNQPFKVSCKVNGYPKPDIIWMDEMGNILSSLVSTFNLPYDYINILEIKNATKNSNYKCKAVNRPGEDSITIQLKVIRKDYFSVLDIPTDKTIEYKKSDSIKCLVDAYPPAKISWFANGRELHTDNYTAISSDGSLLKIKDMREHLNGNFSCEARNDYNRKNFYFHIFISGFEKPIIDKTTNILQVEKGKDAKITCSVVKGIPKPNITWYFQSQDLGLTTQMDKYEEDVYLAKTETDQSGIYKCIAINDAGQDEHQTELIVGYAPTIKHDLSHVISKKDQKTTLKCVADGIPKPKVEWHLNGARIFNDRNHHIYRDNSLRFVGSMENQGQYECIAINTYGSAEREIKVNFVVPVTISPPKRSTIEVNLGKHLVLPCEADGYPKPNKEWLFYRSDSTKIKKIRPSDASGSINLKSLQIKDSGYYTCIANNKESSANMTYEVIVLALPYIDRSLKRYFMAVVDDLVVIVPCKAIGIPKPDITWTKSGLNIPAGTEWYDIEKDGTLVIKNIDIKSMGTYVCHARNKLGSNSKNFFVEVRPYPDNNIPMKTIYLENGTEANIPCEISHTRVDALRWFKDNKVVAMGDLTLRPVKEKDSGDYICHVSTFTKTSSVGVKVVVGFKPQFVTEPDTEFTFQEGTLIILDCKAYGIPRTTAAWMPNEKKIDFSQMLNKFSMTPDSVGKYTCIVSNYFGSVERSFEIFSSDCYLNIRKDFKAKQPLLIEMPFQRLPLFENSGGHIRIPLSQNIQLYCPSRFTKFPKTEITVVCKMGNFEIDGNNYKYSDLTCQEEMIPQIKRTGRKCNLENTELIKIGFDKRDTFLDVYEVCLDKHNNLAAYVKQKVPRTLSDVDLQYDTEWFGNDLLKYKPNEIYDCAAQFDQISALLRRTFHKSGKCCFKGRQLVDSRSLLPGLSQKAAFTHLNVVPQWSTCGSQNWDDLENYVRNFAKSSYDGLIVYTGTSGKLRLGDVDNDYQIISLQDGRGHSQIVPNYLWKVIQDIDIKASLAVVQLNIPDLTLTEAYMYMPCNDICKDIAWLNGTDWQDTTKGFTFCCKLQDFEKAFQLEGKFGDNKAILNHSSLFLTSRSL